MRNAEIWGGVFFAGLGCFAVYAGFDLGLGQVNEPGPGAIIFWAGAVMVILCSFTIFGPAARTSQQLAELWVDARWGKVLIAVGALIAYAAILGTAGFLLTTFVLLIVLLRVIDPVRWPVAIAVAVGAPAVVWFVVERGLAVRLPSSILLGS
jgi:putative tricarboxylic transport membrane protein